MIWSKINPHCIQTKWPVCHTTYAQPLVHLHWILPIFILLLLFVKILFQRKSIGFPSPTLLIDLSRKFLLHHFNIFLLMWPLKTCASRSIIEFLNLSWIASSSSYMQFIKYYHLFIMKICWYDWSRTLFLPYWSSSWDS